MGSEPGDGGDGVTLSSGWGNIRLPKLCLCGARFRLVFELDTLQCDSCGLTVDLLWWAQAKPGDIWCGYRGINQL